MPDPHRLKEDTKISTNSFLDEPSSIYLLIDLKDGFFKHFSNIERYFKKMWGKVHHLII